MRKFLKIFLSFLVILIGVALILPFLIPLDTYKKEATAKLSEMTGREIRIDGNIRLKLLPDISIALNQVKVGNPRGFSAPYLANIDSLDIEVALAPLFDRQVQIQRLILHKPDIYLETLANGRTNWNVEFNAPAVNSSRNGEMGREWGLIGNAYAQEAAAPAAKKSFSLSSVNLSGFAVDNGTLHYMNAQTKSAQELEAINIKANAVSVNKPLGMDGSLKWNGETFDIAAKAASLQALMDKKPTQIAAKIDSTHVKINYTGSATQHAIKGKIDLGSPSLTRLMVWLKKPMDYNKTALLFAAQGNVECANSTCRLSGAQLAVDDLRFTGDVGITFAAKNSIKANLKTTTLDLSPYMNKPQASWQNPLISEAFAISSRWSQKRFDASSLNAMDAEVTLSADTLIAPPWQAQGVALHATLQNGSASLDINRAKLFGGAMQGLITLTPRKNALSVSTNLDASNIQIEPFLKTLNDDSRISGTGAFKLTFSGTGSNQAELISSVDGHGSIMIRDGAIKGVNLAQMARNIKSAFTAQNPGAQQTDFAELGGTYTISNGVISNQDLAMKAPFVRLKGSGIIHLPDYTIHYRLVPELVETSKGQGGKDKTGIAVPILVSGSLDNPQFAPDLQNIIEEAIKDPEKFKENIQGVKEGLKEHKQELKDIRKDLKEGLKDPQKLLENPKVNDMINQFR